MREIQEPPPLRGAPTPRGPKRVNSATSLLSSDADLVLLEHECHAEGITCWTTRARSPLSRMDADAATESIWDASLNGGNSRASEAMAYKVLNRTHGATLHANETQVKYKRKSKVVDMILECGNQRAGVSVTRVYNYRSNPLSSHAVYALLNKKLLALESARDAVDDAFKWEQGVVFVWVAKASHLELVVDAWKEATRDITRDVLVVCNSTNMPWIF